MTDEKDIMVEMLRELLGNEKMHDENHGQISFNCPVCDDGRGKGNLEVNYLQHVYKCWSCSESNDTHGPLGKLIDLYGNKKHKKLYKIFQPEDSKPKEKPKSRLRLPEGFTLFKDSNPRYPVRQQAYNYLKTRGITDDLIEKYRIGFCDKGSHIGRIIVPSYNKEGELTYYIEQGVGTPSLKAKYKNPQVEKDKIIFNEDLIDWSKDIYLVEGVFDGFFLPNSIPMLGNHMSELLFNTLYEKVTGDIIIALDGDVGNAVKLYRELNGGRLYGKIKIIHLPNEKDVCDLKGQIDEYYVQIKD